MIPPNRDGKLCLSGDLLIEFMRCYLSSPIVINNRYTTDIQRIQIDGVRVEPNTPNSESRQTPVSTTPSRYFDQYRAERHMNCIDTKVIQVIATKQCHADMWKLSCIEHFGLLKQFEIKVFDRLYESSVNEWHIYSCDVVQKIQINKLIKAMENRCDRNKIAELAQWLTELYQARRKVIKDWHFEHIGKQLLPF
jgi:hypothetical protein